MVAVGYLAAMLVSNRCFNIVAWLWPVLWPGFGCVRPVTWDLVGMHMGLVGACLEAACSFWRWLGVLSQIPFFRPILWNLRHDR
ncbi:hypothetical protein CFREI_09030 [Corynebacterium freiburgense]|nr:hypothetical protein CFREI_09030 [Corynebacterium freiburgense]